MNNVSSSASLGQQAAQLTQQRVGADATTALAQQSPSSAATSQAATGAASTAVGSTALAQSLTGAATTTTTTTQTPAGTSQTSQTTPAQEWNAPLLKLPRGAHPMDVAVALKVAESNSNEVT
ncbi:MAG: hypothetical protein ABIY56_08400, partial [Dokdonella sp.]